LQDNRGTTDINRQTKPAEPAELLRLLQQA